MHSVYKVVRLCFFLSFNSLTHINVLSVLMGDINHNHTGYCICPGSVTFNTLYFHPNFPSKQYTCIVTVYTLGIIYKKKT